MNPSSPRETSIAPLEAELRAEGVSVTTRAEFANLPPDALEALAADTPLLPPKEPLGARLAGYFGRHQLLLFALCLLALWIILTLPLGQSGDVKLNQPAPRDVVAPQSAFVPDRRETQLRREKNAALVTPAYDPSPSAQSQALSLLRDLLEQTQAAAARARAIPAPPAPQQPSGRQAAHAPKPVSVEQLRRQKLLNEAGWRPPVTLLPSILALRPDGWARVQNASERAVRMVYEKGRIRSDVPGDVDAVRPLFLQSIRKQVSTGTLGSGEAPIAAALVTRAAQFPNVKVNERATEDARKEARNAVLTVYERIEANTPLVREGQTVTEEQWEQLQALGLVSPTIDPRVALARFVLCAILVGAAAVYLARSRRDLLARPSGLWIVAVVPVLFVAIFRVLLRVPHADFLMPPLAATATMLLTVLIDARIGLSAGFLVTAMCALLAGSDAGLFLVSCLSAWIGTLCVSRLPSRAALFRAGWVLTLTNAVLAAALGVMRETPFEEISSTVMWSALSGAGSVAVMAGLAMFLERPFGITSHLRLLELLAPDETVLRRMQTEAPGTYTHSLMVATLSEAAAKAIGADPLLCRVGGLYHDIGKLRRPHCFVENQSGDNIHDRLSPGLSALLIKAHVKDGLELGRAIRLPQPVLEIIQQHHGAGLIVYFYHKARQQAEEAGALVPDEKNFRYAGPRPRSKEAAILMLADSIEASARALPQVTPESLAAHIRTIVQGRLRDGELDEAELTLHDIGVIQEAFTVVLRGVLHHRIEYPDPAELNRDGQDWVRETLRTDTLTPEGLVEGPEHGPKMVPARPARRGREREGEEESGTSPEGTDAEVAEKRQNSKDKDGKSRERRRGRKAGANNPDAGRNGRAPREEKPASESDDADGANRRRLTTGFKTGFPAFHVQRHDGQSRVRNGQPSKSPEDGGETTSNGQHSASEGTPDGALEPPGTPIPGHPLPPTGVGPAGEGRSNGSLAGKHPQPNHAVRGQNGTANGAAALPRAEEAPESRPG